MEIFEINFFKLQIKHSGFYCKNFIYIFTIVIIYINTRNLIVFASLKRNYKKLLLEMA